MKNQITRLAMPIASKTVSCQFRQFLIVGTAASLWLCGGANLLADTHYVSIENKRPKSPFTTWATAATNIQQSVDVASAGDVVLVNDGVYATGMSEVVPRTAFKWWVRLLIPKAITLRSVNGPQATVIDGGQQVGCIAVAEGVILAGFTVRNGYALFGDGGGGVYCLSTNALVMDCVITGNRGTRGGGVYAGTLYNCILSGNTAYITGGGGVPPEGGDGGGASGSVLNDCTLTGNTALYGGGAAYCTLYNCVLTGNNAKRASVGTPFGTRYLSSAGGGARFCSLFNCTLTGNASTDRCGGVSDSAPCNSIAYFNTVSKSGSGPNYDDTSTLNFCCTAPLPRTGTGNFTLNRTGERALFVNYSAGNLHLGPNSRCINAGSNDYVATETDADSNPRIVDGIVDIGAYEFQ